MKKLFLYLIVVISGLISGGPLVAVLSFFALKYLIKKNKWFSDYKDDSAFEDYIDEYPDDIDKEEERVKNEEEKRKAKKINQIITRF